MRSCTLLLRLAVALALAAATGSTTAEAAWERTWGRDVISGGATDPEICTVAANCKFGVSSGLGGEMQGAQGIATDAAGNVYVAEFTNRIEKFDADGTFLRAWGMDVVTGGATGFEVCTTAASCRFGPG